MAGRPRGRVLAPPGDTPAPARSTRNKPTVLARRGRGRRRGWPAAEGTTAWSRRRRAVGGRRWSGASGPVPVSVRATVSTRLPSATPGSSADRCSSVPNSAIGSAASTRGEVRDRAPSSARPARAAGRPRGSRGRCRRRPRAGRCRAGRRRPAPPTVRRSNASPPASMRLQGARGSTGRRGSGAARSETACCSSVKEKSMAGAVPRLSVGPGQAEAEHGDQVALHLVGAAAEGEDDEAAVDALEAALSTRLGRVPAQVGGLARRPPSAAGRPRGRTRCRTP